MVKSASMILIRLTLEYLVIFNVGSEYQGFSWVIPVATTISMGMSTAVIGAAS